MQAEGNTLVTGANGFLGRALLAYMKSKALPMRAAVRVEAERKSVAGIAGDTCICDYDSAASIKDCLGNVTSIVHLAARVHMMNDTVPDPLDAYRRVNRDITVRLAEAALNAGVKRFIYISSVKVVRRTDSSGRVEYLDVGTTAMDDYYGLSKLEAEKMLKKLFLGQTKTRCVVLRLPFVYGPGNKGNMLPLLKAASKGIPFPLGSSRGKRSMIYVGNVCDSIVRVLSDAAPNHPIFKEYFINDCHDLTSGELYSMICREYSGKKGVFPFPVKCLRILGAIGSILENTTGRKMPLNSEVMSRLLDEYRFSAEEFCHEYRWSPPYTPLDGIAHTVAWHRNNVR